MQKRSTRIYAFIGAVIGWFALIAQFYLHMKNSPVPVGEAILRFFGYFTIDTNILVALSFTFIALSSNSFIGKFFTKASVITAITVYIIIVGVTYNLILRSTWEPKGLQKLVDELLHTVIPILYVLFWVFFVPVDGLKWKNAFPWLIFPITYMIYAIILGSVTKFYPYPFVDVTKLGYNNALKNAIGILFIMFFLSLALIGAAKLSKRFDEQPKKK